MMSDTDNTARLEELKEAWHTNNRINLFLIDHISDAGMKCTLSKRGGRDVARQFAHMHNVRVWHLEKRAKDLAEGLVLFETKVTPDKSALRGALKASATAMEEFLGGVLLGQPKRRGFKKGIFTTLAYIVAHESHHRGSILLTLKECGHKLDQKTQYAIWAWDQM
ncbi:MAG: hypothetical protein JSW51_04180 [Gemmatimonadota bacterium]|nr:MAG: hypothetical protein JSW51_04180 [Gemmatimonadota bacterium]